MSQVHWVPQEEVLNNVLDVLQDSFVPDSNVQREVQAKLNVLQSNSDLLNYFLLIFEDHQRFDQKTRALSGLILKNNLMYRFDTTPPHVLQLLKMKCLKLLTDPNLEVRSSCSSLITLIALKGGIENWPELFHVLLNHLEGNNKEVCESTIKTLINICEDYLSQRYSISANIDDSIKKLLVKFLDLTASDNRIIRQHSFSLLNDALQKFYDSIKDDFNSNLYLQRLISAANDGSEQIILLVCHGFVIYINNKDENILPLMKDVIVYLTAKSTDTNPDIALQASEFWLAVSKLPTCKDIMREHMPSIVPILLENMKYSEYELNILKGSLEADSNIQDKQEDIKPGTRAMDEEDEESEVGCWTLRKCSAASLDALAVQFQDEFIPIGLHLILEKLKSDDVLVKESAILAIGAISEGCYQGLHKIIPNLISSLISCMDSSHSLIRSITCWTISRYLRFIIYEGADLFFAPVLTCLLRHSLDENKRVQRAAISSFCFFQEDAKLKSLAHLNFIIEVFLQGFMIYKQRSLNLLYDAIGVLAQTIGAEFKSVYNVLMTPLLNKFQSLDDYNNAEEFLAICECLISIITVVELDFDPYASIVYFKCVSVIYDNIQAVNEYDYEELDKDLISGALDLISTLASRLKDYFINFLTNSTLMDQLLYLIQDECIQVRQPALALLGEIIRLCYPLIDQQIPNYIPMIIENLDKRFHIVCNNAAWVIGKLCIAMENKISPYAPQIVEHFIEILQSTDGLQTMYKTVAISLCTLGLVCPIEVAPYLKHSIRNICSTIRNVADCEDKEYAFRGLCELATHNPEAFANEFIYFCDAVASWNNISYDLKDKIRSIIFAFRQHAGEDIWDKVYGNFPEILKHRMSTLYDV